MTQKMQTTKPLSPVKKKEKVQTTLTQHNTNQISKMETSTTQVSLKQDLSSFLTETEKILFFSLVTSPTLGPSFD